MRESKKTASPEVMSELYGIPLGSLANMRSKRIGPKYFKVGKRKVLYFFEDFENWVKSNPVITLDSR